MCADVPGLEDVSRSSAGRKATYLVLEAGKGAATKGVRTFVWPCDLLVSGGLVGHGGWRAEACGVLYKGLPAGVCGLYKGLPAGLPRQFPAAKSC